MEVDLLKEKKLLDTKPNISLNAVLKDFFQRKERVADLLNVVLLKGDPFISADMVETMDSDSSSVVEIEDGHFTTGKRQRDKLVRIGFEDGTKVSFGLEFQSTVDYDMIFRIFFYTNDFLSREQKLDDAQLRLVNLVLFTGEGKWNAKTSLKELAGKAGDDRLNELLSDFSYEVRDLKEIDTSRLRNQEVRDAVEGIQLVYTGKEELLKERKEMSKASLLVIVAATGRWDVYDEVMKKEGEKIVMCEAFDRLINDIEERYLMIGEKKTCIKILKQLIGEVSEETQIRIMNCSKSKVDKLLDNLLSIKNETEIQAYLN